MVKDGPFVFDELGKKQKKHVQKALERCEVRRINPTEYRSQIWEVTYAAYRGYENADNELSKESFDAELRTTEDEYWGAFCKDNGRLAGWMSCENGGDRTETKKAKYHPELQKEYRPSDALHYAVLSHYLNELHYSYVFSGTRNINHKTNVQDYKIDHWKFRKAYCYLHVEYRSWFGWAITMLYPFRKVFQLFDNNTKLHQLNSLLLMEKISRECRRRQRKKFT